MQAVTELRRPEYTGENRCTPCTIGNVLIAIALSGGVFWIGTQVRATALGTAAAAGVFAVSLSAIYLRGYLVPGTPTVTRRYLPRRLRRLFGKTEIRTPTADRDPDDGSGPAGILADVLADEDFRAEWARAIEEADGMGSEALLDALGTDGHVETHRAGNVFRVHVDGPMVGKWPSRAAFVADLASVAVLSDRVEAWEELPVDVSADLLNRLRARLETCPECGGVAEHGVETVEGCCGPLEATTVSCTDCGARLYIEACPDCGSAVELGTDTVAESEDVATVATISCTDCSTRVAAVPASLLAPQ